LGGPGGERFDDVTSLGLLNKDYVFRVNNLLLWGADNERFPAFEASYLVLDGSLSGVQWPAKHNIYNYPGSAPRYIVNLETGDVIEKMFGYFFTDPSLHRGLFLLNAVGFDIRKADGTLQTYTVGIQEGHYQSVMGPIVGFWGGLGGAFDQLGVYVDPAWWPDRPTRMLKTDLHGRLRSYPNWTHFDDVNALSNPFVVRMTHIIVSYNDTGIFGMFITYQLYNSSVISIQHGSSPPAANVASIPLTKDEYVGELEVEWGSESDLLDPGLDCLKHLKITVVSDEGHKVSYTFGADTRSWTTSNPVVAFHGVVSDTCIKRLGGYILLPGEEFPRACVLPDPPENGQIVGTPDVVGEGTAILFSCNTGYRQRDEGSSYMTCKSNGFWKGTPPVCVPDETATGEPQEGGTPGTNTSQVTYFNALTIVFLVAAIVAVLALVALSVCLVVLCVRWTKKRDNLSVKYTTSGLDAYDGSSLFNSEHGGKENAMMTNPLYDYKPQSADFK
jgi:hypothetical protein